MARLSSNQATALAQVATKGMVDGYLIDRTIPSLIDRGLITKEVKQVEERLNFNYRPGNIFSGPAVLPGGVQISYFLTEKGQEAYIKMRTKRYESQRAALDKEFEADLATAKRKTR